MNHFAFEIESRLSWMLRSGQWPPTQLYIEVFVIDGESPRAVGLWDKQRSGGLME